MSMKYKLLLCVVLLFAFAAAVYAAPVQIYEQTFDPANATSKDNSLNYTKWTLTGSWAVTTAKGGTPAIAPPTGFTQFLTNNPAGNYVAGTNAAATTTAIDCSKNTSVTLSFLRSLTIEDSAYDQFTVAVSNDGSSFTTIYKNPTNSKTPVNLTDPAWNPVTYDISSVADGKSTVYIRFQLVTNSTNDNGGKLTTALTGLQGPCIADIVLDGAGPDEVSGVTIPAGPGLPSGMSAYGALPSLPQAVWQVGAAQAGGGHSQTDDVTDPANPVTYSGVGADPADNAAGTAGGNVIGTVLGAPFNYPGNMANPAYLQWGPLNLTGVQKSALQFERWLNIYWGSIDRAFIQVHVTTPDPADPNSTDPMAPEVAADNSTAMTLNVTTPNTGTLGMDTTEHYDPLSVSYTYNTRGLATGEQLNFAYTLDKTASTITWVRFLGGIITTNTYDTGLKDNGAQTISFGQAAFANPNDYIAAQDNPNFAVEAFLSKGTDKLDSTSTAIAYITDANVAGVLWSYVWDNKVTSPNAQILDAPAPTGAPDTADWGGKGWTQVSYDLSKFGADNNENVWVRWAIGPTTSNTFPVQSGGWNLDDIQVVSASGEWKPVSTTAPALLGWGKTGTVSVKAENTGTATWDKTYSLLEVQGVSEKVQKPGEEPGLGDASLMTVQALPAASQEEINRWDVGNMDVSGTVAANGTFTFTSNALTAPPLSSVVYPVPVTTTAPADPDLSVLDCDWALNNTEANNGDGAFLPTFLSPDTEPVQNIAHAGVTTSKFPDYDAANPTTTGLWARYWIEELAGRVPFIVQGYPDGTYQPTITITRDQIAVYMARSLNLKPSTAAQYFPDVASDFWAYEWIQEVKDAGIVSGFPDGSYQPSLTITRDAMAKYIANSMHYVDNTFVAAPTLTADPFPDVPYKDDSTATPPIVANVFAPYIKAIADAGIVTGYPAGTDSNGNPIFLYQPAVEVSRDQLAVFVWRALVRDIPSAVVLGGPSITPVAVTTGDNPYYGYIEAGTPFTDGPFTGGVKAYPARLAEQADSNTAYVTLDALRLGGKNGAAASDLAVTFNLVPTYGSTAPAVSQTVTVPAVQLNGWISNVLASTTGQPYENVAWTIPSGLYHGDYKLVVDVDYNGVLGQVGRQPAYSIIANIYQGLFNTSTVLADENWKIFGQPSTPGPVIYPFAEIANDSSFEPNTDLYDGDGSLELTGTQQVVKVYDTTNRHNIRVGAKYAQDGTLGSNDAIEIDWSPDYGKNPTSPTWNKIVQLKGSSVPKKLGDKINYFPILPNGDPNASPDPVIGADDNPNFAIRLMITSTSKAKIFFDDLQIDGT